MNRMLWSEVSPQYRPWWQTALHGLGQMFPDVGGWAASVGQSVQQAGAEILDAGAAARKAEKENPTFLGLTADLWTAIGNAAASTGKTAADIVQATKAGTIEIQRYAGPRNPNWEATRDAATSPKWLVPALIGGGILLVILAGGRK